MDMDDIDDAAPPRRYTFRCRGWAADYGPCGDPDCSRCGPFVAVPAEEPADDDADGEE